MPGPRWVARWRPIALVVLMPAAATVVSWWLDRADKPGVLGLFLIGVIVCIRFAGVGAGIAASILSLASLIYWFLPPFDELRLSSESFVSVIIFAATVAGTGGMYYGVQRARRSVETALVGVERAERATADAEARMRVAVEGARMGVWEWRVADDTIIWSRTVFEIHGLDPTDGTPDFERFLSLIHPDDRAEMGRVVGAAIAGGRDYEMEFRALRPDGEVRWLWTRATPISEGGCVDRLVGVTQDVTERHLHEQREHASQRLAAGLSAAVDVEAIADVVFAAATRALPVDAVTLGVRERGTLEIVVASDGVQPSDGVERRAARCLADEQPLWLEAPVTPAPPPSASAAAPDSGSEGFLPLIADGEAIGFVGVQRTGIASFTPAERGFLGALAHQVAVAVHRSITYEHEREAREAAERAVDDTRLLQRLSARLAAAASVAAVADVLVEELVSGLDAAAGTVLMLDDRDASVELRASRGLSPEIVDRYRAIPLSARLATTDVIRTRSPRWFASAASFRASYPDDASPLTRLGARLFEPITIDEKVIGVVTVGYRGEVDLPKGRRDLAASAVSIGAQALGRARLFEAERKTAVALQRSILPARVPELDDAAVAVRYLPGTRGLEVGGDWYDVIPLDEHVFGVCVGDVVGRGIQAATTMAQYRHALRAYALEGLPPAQVLERLDRLSSPDDTESFATVFYAVIDAKVGTCRYASAGHLPGLLIAADGAVRMLDAALAPPLGMDLVESAAEETVCIDPGETLFLYTDGLVEERDRPLEVRLAELRELASSTEPFLERFVDDVLASMLGDGVADDVAVLAVRLAVEPAPSFSFAMTPLATELASVRDEIRGWLTGVGAPPDDVDELVLVCSELCANAIEHPVDREPGSIEVSGESAGAEITLTVRDRGGWRPWTMREDRGLGLEIVRALVDQVDIERHTEGSHVVVRRRIGVGR